MRLLLDTHIWIWLAIDPVRIEASVALVLEDVENTVYVSPISVWEAVMLAESGKVAVESGTSPRQWVGMLMAAYDYVEAPMNHEVALRSRELGLQHRDPADRFLAATASVYELTLVTSDRRPLGGSGYSTLANVVPA